MDDLIVAVRAGLIELADPVKAPQLQRYMKSEMPLLGVAKPARAALARKIFSAYPIQTSEEWINAIYTLWREATYREERYLAIALSGDNRYRDWQTPGLLSMYDEMITTGAWWDFVDEIAIHRIGPILLDFPEQLTPIIARWSGDLDRWRRRSSVICQNRLKEKTNLNLLELTVEANIDDPDFFLRKGIGWALREQAKINPGWVRAFIARHPTLSPLSVREATKHIGQ